MNRQHRPSPIHLPTVVDLPEQGYDSSASTMYLLTPGSNAETGSLSATPSPLTSPGDLSYKTDPAQTRPSVFENQRYPAPLYAPSHNSYTPSGSQYCNPNFNRRASIAVEPSYQYTFPRSTSTSLISTAQPLSAAEQEHLPSWRRDFDKLSDPTVKERWSRELYDDFLGGRIPMNGRTAQDIIDWETCVAKVNGRKDADATAKMLVAAQERKAELQAGASRKQAVAEKEPPRRQNKFICYRSLRSSQLATRFTNFKQSQFSAITSMEWKEIDTDWWGDVANLVEEVRRAKYFGQLDVKGNPVRRGSTDSQYSDPSPFTTAQAKPRRVSKSGKSQPRRASAARFDPYTTTPMRPTSTRVASYTGSSPLGPALAYRHSIDMGTMPSLVANQLYSAEASGLGLYDHAEVSGMSASTSFPTLTTIPQSPMAVTTGVSSYTPAPAPAVDHSYLSDSFTYPSNQPPATPIAYPNPTSAYFSSPTYAATPTEAQPHPYLPQNWTSHRRGETNELMEMYTMAQDFTPASGHVGQAQCWGPGEWTSYYPGMAAR